MPGMHTGPLSPPPADFHVAVAGSDVSGLLVDPQLAAYQRDPARPPIMSRVRKLSRHPNYLDDTSVWWGTWMPVATTGWGALFLVVPLLVTHFLVWATGTRRAE